MRAGLIDLNTPKRKERPFGAAPSRWAIVAFLVLAVVGAACSEDFDPDQAIQEGLAQQQAGNLEEAAALYDQVLQVRPGDKFANYNMGVIEQGSGRPLLAEGFYRAALDTDPKFAAALFNLAILRTNAGASQEAIDLYLRVVDVQPDNASALFNLGLLYLNAGETELGEERINAALAIDPTLAERLGPDSIPTDDAAVSPEPPGGGGDGASDDASASAEDDAA